MKPYVPEELPLSGLDHRRLIGLVGRANAELARYDGLLQGVVNPQLMLSPLTTQEAVLSSRIEGTQATFDEVLQHEAGDVKEGNKAADIREIINYRTALTLATEVLRDKPITLSLIRQTHRELMDSVRGRDKTPGEFRREQNWIGRPGCAIEDATFVPPSPLIMGEHLERWVGYIRTDDVDVLVQLAVVHAQFELIHPFKDANGRIGRLLIPLFLFQKRVLSSPSFYLSGYLETNRDTYYDRLQAISRDGDWNGWIEFFLRAVISQARLNSVLVQEIQELYQDLKARMVGVTRSPYAIAALDAIFRKPMFQTTAFAREANLTRQTASTILRALREEGLISEWIPAAGRRPAIMEFPALLQLVEKDRRPDDAQPQVQPPLL